MLSGLLAIYTHLPPLAIFYCIRSKAEDPVVRDRALAGTKKAMIHPASKQFLGHPSLNSPPRSRLVSPSCRACPAGSGKASNCLGAKHQFLAKLLLPLNLGQQKFFLALGAVNIAGPQLSRQTVAVPAE